jgi:hypothetical protein
MGTTFSMNTSLLTQLRAARAAALALTLACAGGAIALTAAPAAAQMDNGGPATRADAAASGGYYDGSKDVALRHVVAGTIANSSAFRVLLAIGSNRTVNVDLENGTEIHPTGTSLAAGMHVEAHGHWSKGTFIADSVNLQS